MNKDVLAHGTIRDLITQIEAVPDAEDGHYYLYAPAGIAALKEDMEAAIILESRWKEDDDPLPEFALERGLEPACDISLAQDVIIATKSQKPEANTSELILALNYFLDHDAFLEFEE